MGVSEEPPALGFDDVLIKPEISEIESRAHVNLFREFSFRGNSLKCIPVIAANMDTAGCFGVASAICPEGFLVALHKHYSYEQLDDFLSSNYLIMDKLFLSCGIDDKAYDNILKLALKYEKFNICLDIANGYMLKFHQFIERVRNRFPNKFIIAGNVCDNRGIEAIFQAGANWAKGAIGTGSRCLTSNKAGVGQKQLQFLLDAKKTIQYHEYKGGMCSDGGCKSVADVCKAFVSGSDLVMLGGMIMGHEECTGDWKYEYKTSYGTWQPVPSQFSNSEKRKHSLLTWGMSSKGANDKYNGGLSEYKTAEGKEEWVLNKGPIKNLLQDIKGGLASCGAYTNKKNIADFNKAELIRV